MMDVSTKVRENRLRRMAERQGLRLEKSRRRDPRARDYGRWYIIDAEREQTAAEIGGYDRAPIGVPLAQTIDAAAMEFVVQTCDGLDDLEAFLTGRGEKS